MWKEFIAPTLLVSGLWMVVTPVSIFVKVWLDHSYQSAFRHNQEAIQSAGVVREDVWRLISYADAGDLSSHSGSMTREIERALADLQRLTESRGEAPLLRRLQSEWQAMVARIGDRDSSNANLREMHVIAESISALANEIRVVNRANLIATERRLGRWTGAIRMLRLAFVLVGTSIGIMWWWRISRRFHRSLSQINFILKDATLEWEQSLAQLRIVHREDLGELRERVERMVQRLQAVTSELDVTRREAIQSERLAAVGELAAGVAHELRNPLTSVKLLLQYASGKPGETKLDESQARVVLEEISRMEHTIQGLLDFSRPPSAQRRRHDLLDTLQRAMRLVQGRAKQQGVCIQADLLDHAMIVHGDREQLHQVCVNLLINGIESMDSGGILEIRIEANPGSSVVSIHFRDHGPGIGADVLAHMFEPFVSTKLGGTGLGLAISHNIIRQHGGSLVAQNHPDGGAVVSLALPLDNHNESDRQVPGCKITPAAVI